ncbi:hypothetical protein PTKIN_Ptkin07bG0020600 [Pterospermum kingtungense]
MLEALKNLAGLNEQCKAGHDFFNFYAREITNLLLQDESTLPASNAYELSQGKYGVVNGKDAGSLFEYSIGAGLSDSEKRRLKGLLRQNVNDLSMEVDEV